MKIFMGLFLFLLAEVSLAASLKINISPKEPVFDQPFEVEFVINSEEGTDPVISFDPVGVQVLNRSQGGVSTRTSYINGKMTFSRTISVKYELLAPKEGTVYLKKIKAQINNKSLTHRNLNIRILNKPRKALDIFVKAEVEKEQYYIGESILVRYYLYSKATMPLNSMDLKKFPKLDKFLKRYHQEKSVPVRIQINGDLYTKRIVYTAQLFGEKPGQYTVDPISLKVSYSSRESSSLGNFGFGLRLGRLKSTSIRSKPIKIDILPLPAAGMPGNFSGLVGEHNFKLISNKQKFLSNEPIEMQLIVEGAGALEVFVAPKLLNHDLIEEFETNADLKINPDFSSQKVFDYTYLGRGSVKIDKFNYSLSYFNPKTESYKTVNLEMGPFEIVAIGNVTNKKQVGEKQKTQNSSTTSPAVFKPTRVEYDYLYKPIYKSINSFIFYSKHIFYFVGIVLILFLIYLSLQQFSRLSKKERTVFEEIYTKGVTYSNLFKVVNLLGSENSMDENIKNSNLSDGCKKYFQDLIGTVNSKFGKEDLNKKFKIQKKYFLELENYINTKSGR